MLMLGGFPSGTVLQLPPKDMQSRLIGVSLPVVYDWLCVSVCVIVPCNGVAPFAPIC